MNLKWPPKDPAEVLDYIVDWSARLPADLIANSTFTVSGGANVAIVANSYSNTTTTVWLASGTAGRVAKITNQITTVGGRTFEESVNLTIQQK
jgi:hypothetical protein